ncbi:MAG: hypothetical protein ACTS27_09050 [Phycisphaerales bacterium]
MQSVHTLVQGLFDYAGLFPPAKLEMAPTVRNYSIYRNGWQREVLARLVVPVARLDEFEREAAEFLPREVGESSSDDAEGEFVLVDPWRITALTKPAGDPALEADLDRIARFNDDHAEPDNGLAVIDALEIKAGGVEEIEKGVEAISPDFQAFFELPWHVADIRGMVAAVAGEGLGAKVRTGGITDDLFPPCDALARFIRACATAETPMKATAGLHHPIRHFNEGQGVTMHGFVNVIMASAMAYRQKADLDTLTSVLDERAASAFTFTEHGIVWRNHKVSVDDLESTRDRFFQSIGSCSIDEPTDDLKALGLLDLAV